MGAGFGLIVVGGVILESTINFLNHEDLQWLWDLEVVVEETLEMLGSLTLAYALCVWRDHEFNVTDGAGNSGVERTVSLKATPVSGVV